MRRRVRSRLVRRRGRRRRRAAAATPVLPDGPEWQLGTYTTRYWDCCKPSCAWNGKGDVDRPVLACEAETGEILTDANVAGVCDGGTAASCASNQPWTYNDGVSLGFAAASVGGNHGLNGDENCGQCYELVWSDEGGAHPDIVGKSHIIQVTNIGYDVTGDHSFDLQIRAAARVFSTDVSGSPGLFEAIHDDFDRTLRRLRRRAGRARLPSSCSRLRWRLRLVRRIIRTCGSGACAARRSSSKSRGVHRGTMTTGRPSTSTPTPAAGSTRELSAEGPGSRWRYFWGV